MAALNKTKGLGLPKKPTAKSVYFWLFLRCRLSISSITAPFWLLRTFLGCGGRRCWGLRRSLGLHTLQVPADGRAEVPHNSWGMVWVSN
jgi:hypothetical protein